MRWLADLVIALAKRRVYRKGHIYSPDGSLYMARYALFETTWLSARVHHIARPDSDRHMHDHPWWFASLVLRGGYAERRPADVNPCFHGDAEHYVEHYRTPGSFAFRRPTDRHIIAFVERDTWSLFVYGRLRQWWGFFTPQGKVYWKDYVKDAQ